MADIISPKKGNIFIWCYADQFIKENQISGFCTGMFISEMNEAIYYDFWDVEQQTIEESNKEFAKIVSKYLNEPFNILYKNSLNTI